MLDPKLVREKYEAVKKGLESRGYPLEFLDKYVQLDIKWRQQLQALENLKCERNKNAPEGKPSEEQLERLKVTANKIKVQNESLQLIEQQVREAALLMPNIPVEEVPFGESEEDNLEIKRYGGVPEFSFKPESHQELAERLGILDFESAAKVTGSRFVFGRSFGARMERALINFMLDVQTTDNSYQEILPPVVVNSKSMLGTGQLPKFAEDSFQLAGTDYWLSPTAEVQLTNMFRDMIIPEQDLPVNVTAGTTCFRKEAGTYGRDISGIIRQHQFNKVELVKLSKPEESSEQLEKLLADAESILKKLKLPYRVVLLCSGDLGFCSAKTYDIEVWFPSQDKYREISSCSSFLDFQARRAMIRYRKADGEVDYLHTLNGSGLAVGRTMAAIIENYQNEDGSINVPEALQGYMGVEIIK
ncbi:MAG: serine--tRNA ligase [bacterium]|nr:serine--tRNA ligase [bacterium]